MIFRNLFVTILIFIFGLAPLNTVVLAEVVSESEPETVVETVEEEVTEEESEEVAETEESSETEEVVEETENTEEQDEDSSENLDESVEEDTSEIEEENTEEVVESEEVNEEDTSDESSNEESSETEEVVEETENTEEDSAVVDSDNNNSETEEGSSESSNEGGATILDIVTPSVEVVEVFEELVSEKNNKITTYGNVELDVVYTYEDNEQVQVIFTKLPENPGSLFIEEVTLSDEQVESLGALSNIAYDITSDMENGSFEYDLRLPAPKHTQKISKIVYADSAEDLEDDVKGIIELDNIKVEHDDETIAVEDLNHFTIFVVTSFEEEQTTAPEVGYNGIWFAYGSGGDEVERFISGTNGITSSVGNYHGEMTGTAFTRWDGYKADFPEGGYDTRVDVYLDMDLATGSNDDRFDFSSAINKPDNTHRRDFIFHLGTNPSESDEWLASVSNNAPGWPGNPSRSPVSITESGWYTLEHQFRDVAGVLEVTLNIYKKSDSSLVGSWVLSDPSDLIGSTVGGNRYGWFVGSDFDVLAIDQAEIEYDEEPPMCDGVEATIFVGSDNIIVGGPDDGMVYSGHLEGTGNDDVIVGTEGIDSIRARGGNDLVCGLGGDDNIQGNANVDTIYGGEGDDTINGNNNGDFLFGDKGNDTIYGGNGGDVIYGDDGADTIYGGNGNDMISGVAGHDIISGGEGDDKISGNGGKDEICGDEGNDILNGNNGHDTICGGDGDDDITGGNGADKIDAGEGADIVNGGNKNDICVNGESLSNCEDTTTEVEVCSLKEPEPVPAILVIDYPFEDGDEIEKGSAVDFLATYLDDDETEDTVNFAIKPGTCQANTPGVNIAGYQTADNNSSYNFETGEFVATIDFSDDPVGEYCFVVNPAEGDGPDLREVRTFNLVEPEPDYPYGVITSPEANEEVDGGIVLSAEYFDGDEENDDIVQWALRAGTCSAGTNTVAGNVDGFSDSYEWDGNEFSAEFDAGTFDAGEYCFIFNPRDDGDVDVRETQVFTIIEDDDSEGGDDNPGSEEKDEETIVVTGDNLSLDTLTGWLFNRDTSTTTPFEFNDATSVIGDGALYVLPIGGDNASDKFIGELFLGEEISSLDKISYDFAIGSGGDVSDENEFYMNVYANFGESDPDKYYDCRYSVVPTVGLVNGFTTVTFDPTQSYPVTTRSGGSASPYTCPSIPSDMDTLSPNSIIRMAAINLGDTSLNDEGVDGYFDNVVVETDDKITTYDFEPEDTDTSDDSPSVSFTSGSSAGGSTSGGSTGGGEVLGASIGLSDSCSGPYINSYIGLNGIADNPIDVLLLQVFLMLKGYDVSMTGTYDQQTRDAVSTFQLDNQSDILSPWSAFGLGPVSPTGVVYKTTKWKINNLVCPGSEAYPLLP
jgi:hypothetical protein